MPFRGTLRAHIGPSAPSLSEHVLGARRSRKRVSAGPLSGHSGPGEKENGILRQRDAEQGHAQRWHQKRIRRDTGGVLRLQGLQTEVDQVLQVDQLRSLGLSQERTGERDAEPGGDGLRQDQGRGQDRLLRGGLRLPQLEGVPGGEPGTVPEEVQGHQRDRTRSTCWTATGGWRRRDWSNTTRTSSSDGTASGTGAGRSEGPAS